MPSNNKEKSKSGRATKRGAEDAISLLEADHKKVKSLLKQLSSDSESASDNRQELLEQIETELKAHTQIEEEVFYAEFKEAAKESDLHLYFEAMEEHRVVDMILPDLMDTGIEDEEFSARAKVLREMVEHHIEEEEGEMFPRARKAFDADQLEEIGQRMAQMKREILGEGGMEEEAAEDEDQRPTKKRSA